MDGIDVYPVGWLAAWKLRHIKGQLRRQVHYTEYQLRRRNWRAIRNSLNGYLAELDSTWPATRCGHGWTKKRAINDLLRHMADNVTD